MTSVAQKKQRVGSSEYEALARSAATELYPDVDSSAMALCFNLIRAANRMTKDLEVSAHRPMGLSFAGYRLLFTIKSVRQVNPNELARLSSVSTASMSSLLNTLEKYGLLTRTRDPEDFGAEIAGRDHQHGLPRGGRRPQYPCQQHQSQGRTHDALHPPADPVTGGMPYQRDHRRDLGPVIVAEAEPFRAAPVRAATMCSSHARYEQRGVCKGRGGSLPAWSSRKARPGTGPRNASNAHLRRRSGGPTGTALAARLACRMLPRDRTEARTGSASRPSGGCGAAGDYRTINCAWNASSRDWSGTVPPGTQN